MKHITSDLTAGLGLSNLHIQDGGLSPEDDLGKSKKGYEFSPRLIFLFEVVITLKPLTK